MVAPSLWSSTPHSTPYSIFFILSNVLAHLLSIDVIFFQQDVVTCSSQTCHLVRIVRIQYGFWPLFRWYGRITLWYGFEEITENNLWITHSETKVLSSTQLAFSVQFQKDGRFHLPWSTIDLIPLSRQVKYRPKAPILVLCCCLSIFITQCRSHCLLKTAGEWKIARLELPRRAVFASTLTQCRGGASHAGRLV